MKIINHRLYKDDKTSLYREGNPNIGPPIDPPKFLIIHYTAGSTVEGAIATLTSPKDNSPTAHLVIGRDGSITQLVPFNCNGYHAGGTSTWRDFKNMNLYSIGIELDNAGYYDQKVGEKWKSSFGKLYDPADVFEFACGGHLAWHRYTPIQLDALNQVSKLLLNTYPIQEVLGHQDVLKTKSDPGPAFPMETLRQQLFSPPAVSFSIGEAEEKVEWPLAEPEHKNTRHRASQSRRG